MTHMHMIYYSLVFIIQCTILHSHIKFNSLFYNKMLSLCFLIVSCSVSKFLFFSMEPCNKCIIFIQIKFYAALNLVAENVRGLDVLPYVILVVGWLTVEIFLLPFSYLWGIILIFILRCFFLPLHHWFHILLI